MPIADDRPTSACSTVRARNGAMRSLGRWLANRLPMLSIAWLAASTAAIGGVIDAPCPPRSIAVAAGQAIQTAVDSARDGAAFCLKNGIHRMQVIRPKPGQSFHGEGQTVLNGSRLLDHFSREGTYWVASGQTQRGRKHGECSRDAPACDLPEAVFIDDHPLVRVLSKDGVGTGRFYLDYGQQRLYLADDPTGRKVEVTVGAFAFASAAPSVKIRNLTIEKYASVAQKGAIQAEGVTGWIVENCEVRLNSGGGIAIGDRGRIRSSDIHHNGQIGIAGSGQDILIENNRIWANNSRGFSTMWEAGGIKLGLSDGVVFRGNNIYDNIGSGVWCDIECRNVVYEGNLVERNTTGGIAHEISFGAIIRNNILRHNGITKKSWYWHPDVLIANSQDVEVYGNTLTVRDGGCGIVLIDQSRATKRGAKYKTRNDWVHDNELTFEGAACAGGASDAEPGDENYAIITDGNNMFDRNVYRVARSAGPHRFVWGHKEFDWQGLRQQGLETNGQLLVH